MAAFSIFECSSSRSLGMLIYKEDKHAFYFWFSLFHVVGLRNQHENFISYFRPKLCVFLFPPDRSTSGENSISLWSKCTKEMPLLRDVLIKTHVLASRRLISSLWVPLMPLLLRNLLWWGELIGDLGNRKGSTYRWVHKMVQCNQK